MTGRIFLKLILTGICVLAVALAAVDYLASKVAERTYIATLSRELAEKAKMLALTDAVRPGTDRRGLRELAAAAASRITLIGPDGVVLADSEAEPAHMENHGRRPEVRAALSGQTGSDTRRSATVGLNFLYVAVPVGGGGALRLAIPLRDIQTQVTAITRQLLIAVVLAFIPAAILAAFFARYVSRKLGAIINYAGRLARGEYRPRLSATGRDELGILAEQLNVTGEKLENTFHALEQEHQKLEQLERVRKDFVINVSHELRTPLASIQGYTETLLDGGLYDSEHNIRFLGIIRSNAERLGRLIGDLMTLSQVELKRTKFQFASYDMKSILTDCVDAIAPIAQKNNVIVELEPLPPRLEAFCDSEAVHQILTNLLDNAIKYTPAGGRITVAALQRPTDREHIEILVRDTGIGIPAEDLPRLFERFYRVDKARSRELGGTGLGLAIVKHLVLAQGGEVHVSSEVNKGSTFSFTLPVHDLGLEDYPTVQAELTNL